MKRIEMLTQCEYETLTPEELAGLTEQERDDLFKRVFWRADVESHVQKRSELSERGFHSMEVYLNVCSFYLLSVNRNPTEQNEFEKWSCFSHEYHLLMIADLERSRESFIEIPPCPDDYEPGEWLVQNAAEKGVTVFLEGKAYFPCSFV